MDRPDYHNEVELNFIKSGTITYLFGGKRRTVQSGELAVFWAAIPHQVIQYSEDASYYVATIPLQSFLQWCLPESIVQPLLQGAFLSESDFDKSLTDERLFSQWVLDLQQEAVALEKPVLSEMQARLLRLAINLPSVTITTKPNHRTKQVHHPTTTESGLSKVEQMACYIAQNYVNKITIREIGKAVNLHPNYAVNLFQKTFGTTLVNYITQHRVSHAQRLLTTTDQSITEIALQSGFQSISRFNEAFSRLCGCSPREYRKSYWAGSQ